MSHPGLAPALSAAIDAAMQTAQWPAEYADVEALAATVTLAHLAPYVRTLLDVCERAATPGSEVADAVIALRAHYPGPAA